MPTRSDFRSEITPTHGTIFHSNEKKYESESLVRLQDGILIIEAPTYHERVEIDVAKLTLPSNGLYPNGLPLLDRQPLLDVAIRVIRLRAAFLGETKSLPRFLKSVFLVTACIIQYGWANGLYDIQDWTEFHFKDALRQYCGGGMAQLRQKHLTSDGGCESIVPGLLADEAEIADGRPSVTSASSVVGEPKLAASSVSGFIYVCNLLADAAELSFQPFVNPRKLAAKLGRQAGNSENTSAAELYHLMRECYEFYLVMRDSLIEAFEAVAKVAEKNPSISEIQVADELSKVPAFCRLDAELPSKFTNKFRTTRDVLDTLYILLQAFQICAFYLIGFMNARRPDEIVHKVVGVGVSNFRSIDDILRIYQVEFYLEKGARIRVPYFVNELTYEILRSLARISESAPSWMNSEAPRSVFSAPDYRGQTRAVRHMRLHRSGAATSARWEAATKLCRALTRPHEPRSMRRGYAMLYQHRYIYSSIPALQQQLGHATVQETFGYFSNSVLEPKAIAALYGPLNSEQKKSFATDISDLAKELRVVGEERLLELVMRVLERDPTVIGGFSKIIRRLHLTLMPQVSYAEMDTRRKAISIKGSLVERGHSLAAKFDGDCWRGTSRSNFRGRCQEHGDVNPRMDRAGVETCNACAYQSAFEAHTRNLEEDEANQRRAQSKAACGALSERKAQNDLASVRRVISLRKAATRGKND